MTAESALRLAQRGLSVFPLSNGTKIPPKDFAWKEEATTDPKRIRELWRIYPNANVGVAAGRGLLILDADSKGGKKGLESLDALFIEGVPDGFRVKTPSGGEHLYLTSPVAHRNLVDRLTSYPGIDIRCDGGYVVGPGSVVDGEEYKIVNDAPPQPAPAWLDETIVTASAKRKMSRTENSVVDLDAEISLEQAKDYLINQAPEAVEGAGGNDTTYRVGCWLRDLGISEAMAVDLMLDHWNDEKAFPRWDPEELAGIVGNAYQYATGAYGGRSDLVLADVFTAVDIGDDEPEAETVAGEKPGKIFKVLDLAGMRAMQAPEWLVENVIVQNTSALMYGKSNAFKSFTAIDLALSVATGREWHGLAVRQQNVLLVATEGANGVGRLRIPGWYAYHAIPEDLQQNAYLFPNEISLDNKTHVDVLIDTMRYYRIGLLLLDIFGGTMDGTEVEDTTARKWTRGSQRILRECGATMLTVAHTGWADETRARMHSHFWGSFDTRLRVEGDKDKLVNTLAIERHKDADSTGQWGFRFEKTNDTLVPHLDDAVSQRRMPKLGQDAERGQRALDAALSRAGEIRYEDGLPICATVHIDEWKTEFYALLGNSRNEGAKRTALSRVKGELMKKGVLGAFGDYVWNIFDAKE